MFIYVGDYINIMKTTLYLNFDLCQAFKQHDTEKHEKCLSLITCTLDIRKKLLNNINLNNKIVFIIFI